MTPDPGLASWLQLSLTPGLGASTVRNLLKQFGLPEAVLARQRAELASFLAPAALEALHSSRVRDAVERALQWAAADDHFVITLADETYPHALLEIADPPPLLYAHGRLPLLRQAAFAVVGSRNASAQGESNAEHFATARSAADQGRDVFAIPGSIHSPLSKGCHALIKSGAKLVESAEDVLAELAGFRPSGYASTAASTTANAAQPDSGLLAIMGHDPVDVDSLCAR